MKTSQKAKEKGKGPRVLANTVKKQERSLNSSGNKSFLNKSTTNRHITDLRNNNARLAHSLATQKKHTAELYQRYTECQGILMGQKAFLRNISYSIKSAVGKFKSAVDLMFDASATCMTIHDKIRSYCPELEEQASANPQGTRTDSLGQSPNQLKTSSVVLNSTASTSTSGSGEASIAVTVPQIRHGTARPMVQGQVISNPTISLQRVVVPTRNLGRAVVKPDRGVHWLNLNNENESRLSAVPEELNVSNRSASDNQISASVPQSTSGTPPRHSLPVSDSNLGLSLPVSHVVLERLSPHLSVDVTPISPHLLGDDDSDSQLTAVNFGSYNYSSLNQTTELPSSSSYLNVSKSESSVIKSPNAVNELNRSSNSSPLTLKLAMNTSNSDDYLTESSSEDEELALQIVESKKYYLERSRQVDSKEGTSWNYDEAGKFRGKPPKRKRSKKDPCLNREIKCQETKKSSKRDVSDFKAKNTHHSKGFKSPEPGKVPTLELKDQAALKLGERQMPTSVQSPELGNQVLNNGPNSRKAKNISNPNSPNDNSEDVLMDTVLDIQDMSLTECIKFPSPVISAAIEDSESSMRNTKSKDKEKNSIGNAVNQQLSEREIYVTKRSRGRKPSADTVPVPHDEPRPSSFSPLNNSLKRVSDSQMENNENSPPISQKGLVVAQNSNISFTNNQSISETPCMVTVNQQDLSQLPTYVVLERLPNNLITGHSNQNTSSNHENAREIKRKKSSTKETRSAPVQQGSPICNASLQSSPKNCAEDTVFRRKRTFAISSRSDALHNEVEDSYNDDSDYMPPKQTSKPQTKQTSRSKESRKKLPNKKSAESSSFRTKQEPLSPQVYSAQSSARSSPQSSSLKKETHADLELSENEGHRPRRNAAPTSLREQRLNKKLRRP